MLYWLFCCCLFKKKHKSHSCNYAKQSVDVCENILNKHKILLKSSNRHHLFCLLHAEDWFLPVWFLSLTIRPPRSMIDIQAIHAHLQCGHLSRGDRKLFWSRRDRGRGEVNWLERYFCWLKPSLSVTIISVISSSATNFCCILGRTNTLSTSHAPNYSTWLDICKLDQN